MSRVGCLEMWLGAEIWGLNVVRPHQACSQQLVTARLQGAVGTRDTQWKEQQRPVVERLPSGQRKGPKSRGSSSGNNAGEGSAVGWGLCFTRRLGVTWTREPCSRFREGRSEPQGCRRALQAADGVDVCRAP